MIRDYPSEPAPAGQGRRAGQMECSQEIQSLHSQSSPASCSELRRYFNWLSRADTLTH